MNHYAVALAREAFRTIRRTPEHHSCAWLNDGGDPYFPHPIDVDPAPLKDLKAIHDQMLGSRVHVTGHILEYGPRGLGRMCMVGESLDACAVSVTDGDLHALVVVDHCAGMIALKDGLKPLSDLEIQWLTMRSRYQLPVGVRDYRGDRR